MARRRTRTQLSHNHWTPRSLVVELHDSGGSGTLVPHEEQVAATTATLACRPGGTGRAQPSTGTAARQLPWSA